jgi:hypothetical protein
MQLAVPGSWLKAVRLGSRRVGGDSSSSTSSSSSSVSLTWRLDVSELKQLVQDSMQQCGQGPAVLQSDDSPPFRGLSWRMQLYTACDLTWDNNSITTFKLLLSPVNAPRNSYYRGSFAMTVAGWEQLERDQLLTVGQGSSWELSSNPFGVGVMSGGWDEVKWVAQGLPASGCVTLTLKVF